jgi:hypothetical protein
VQGPEESARRPTERTASQRNHRAPMRCLHQSGPDACSQLQGLREEGPSSAHPDEGSVGPTPPWKRARAKHRSAGLARSQRAQSPQAAAGRHRELHRCGLRDGRGGAAAKSTAHSGEHRTTRPSRAKQAAWARPEPLSGRARATSLSSRQLPALLQAEGPAALVVCAAVALPGSAHEGSQPCDSLL